MRFVETKNAVKNVVFGETFEVSTNATEKVNAVIAALTDSKYNMRTIAGMTSDTITEDNVVMVLLALFECNLITVYMREDGKVFYRFMEHLAADTTIN